MVPTIQPEQDLSWTSGLSQALDNVKLIRYEKSQKILMTGCRVVDKKIQKCPKVRVFPICDPHIYGALNLCKTLKKTKARSLRYSKTDQRTNHGQGRLLTTPSGEPGVQNKCFLQNYDVIIS